MVTPLAPVELLERGRRGDAVDLESLRDFVEGWLRGGTSDAQMAAWCMAACLRGMSHDAAAVLADALVASGDRLELARLGPTADVLSTGGVGDAAGLVALPLAASLGVRVPSVGGRGLAHTGGLLDRLEAIPGLTTNLPLERFVRQVRDVGVAATSGGDRLVPGERRLAALRGLTGTADGAELVAACTVAAAIAGGAQALVVDVKAGHGGFVPDVQRAVEVGALMADVARPWGRTTRTVVSAMDRPQGCMVGNALEVRSAGEVLGGAGDPDVRTLALRLAALAAEACGVAGEGEGGDRARAALDDGRALATAERWVEAQGGDPGVWTRPEMLPPAPLRLPVPAPATGVLASLDALAVGEAARWLGAGRMHPVQSVDPAVGVEIVVKVGQPAVAGEPIAWIHARDAATGDRAVSVVGAGARVSDAPAEAPAVILREA